MYPKLLSRFILGIAIGLLVTGSASAQGIVCDYDGYPTMRFVGNQLFVGDERTELFFGSGLMSAEWGDGLVFTYDDPPRIATDDGGHLDGDCREAGVTFEPSRPVPGPPPATSPAIATAPPAASAVTATPAPPTPSGRTNWQYTRWGMTVDEVRQASGWQATANHNRGLDAGDQRAELAASYTASGIPFGVSFRFDREGQLVAVSLSSRLREDCIQASALLVRTYGEARERDFGYGMRLRQWWDQANGNQVSYTNIGDTCSIDYVPLETPGASGGL